MEYIINKKTGLKSLKEIKLQDYKKPWKFKKFRNL